MIKTVHQFIFISPQVMNYGPEGILPETERSPEAKTSAGWCG
jgi:hypothetical protein